VSPTYRYRAARSDGRLVAGTIEADGHTAAGAVLLERGLHPLNLSLGDPARLGRASATRRDLAVAFDSLAALTGAGVPLDRALASTETVTRGALLEVLKQARAQLREGRSLAQALEGGRGVVPPLVIGMLRAGERAGQLGPALEQIAKHLEQEADLLARVRQALAYPVLLVVTGAASVLTIVTVVIPQFVTLLGDLGQELPLSTRLVLAASTFLVDHGPLLLLASALAVVSLRMWGKEPAGRLQLDRLLLAAPLLGPVQHALATARFARALSGMLRAGMPLLAALDAAGSATGNAAVVQRLGAARERVAQGQPLARALEQEQVVLASAAQLLAVGESSGQLPAMAARAGDLAAQQAQRRLTTLVTLLEPALIVFFGGLVGLVAAALLQAVYSLRPGSV
jgi:type II secretory pathway component PulF